jgi:hypothetical protein
MSFRSTPFVVARHTERGLQQFGALADSNPDDNQARSDPRPIACVDFNGVLDCYTGDRGPRHFDQPRPGAREFLHALRTRGYLIVVFTTRYADDVWRWLRQFGLDDLVAEVTDRKPPAHVFVDDRAVCFRGDFDATLREIDVFAAHWEAARS